jgi:hypothetical protein
LPHGRHVIDIDTEFHQSHRFYPPNSSGLFAMGRAGP